MSDSVERMARQRGMAAWRCPNGCLLPHGGTVWLSRTRDDDGMPPAKDSRDEVCQKCGAQAEWVRDAGEAVTEWENPCS